MTTDTGPAAVQAVTELLDLAHATRPDVDQSHLNGAIIAAQSAGWSWPKILTTVAGMLARGEEPRDVLNAVQANPVRPHVRRDYQ